MKIIYHCYGGSHSSALAANIHVGNLSINRFPTYQELFRLPYFDRTTNEDFGAIKLVGFDEWGNQVYCLGQMHWGRRFHSTLECLLMITGLREETEVMGTMPHVNLLMKIGGNLSRKRSLPLLGRPVLYGGSRLAYRSLVQTVQEVKNILTLRGLEQ